MKTRVKMLNKPTQNKNYNSLISDIGALLEQGRKQAYQVVNSILVKTYWEIGKRIVEYEQKGKEKAEYGTALLDTLSKDLRLKHGKGFSKSNLIYMRLFYIKYHKSETPSHQLSWILTELGRQITVTGHSRVRYLNK